MEPILAICQARKGTIRFLANIYPNLTHPHAWWPTYNCRSSNYCLRKHYRILDLRPFLRISSIFSKPPHAVLPPRITPKRPPNAFLSTARNLFPFALLHECLQEAPGSEPKLERPLPKNDS